MQASLDDPLLCGTVAVRLGALYTSFGDPRTSIQILRSGLLSIQAARDRAVSQSTHDPRRADDQLALSAASVACFFDAVTKDSTDGDAVNETVAKRPGAGAYGGAGLFGAESQVRVFCVCHLLCSLSFLPLYLPPALA